MQRFLLRMLVTLVALTGTAVFAEAQTAREGVVRVKLDRATAATLGRQQLKAKKGKLSIAAAPKLSASLEQIQVVSIRPAFPYSEKYAAQRAQFGLDQWYEIEFSTAVTPEKARKVMQQTPGVLRADMKVPMKLQEGNGKFKVQTHLPAQQAGVSYPFNDPRLPSQWHYRNFGNLSGMTAGADINAFEAWNITTGSPNVLVAIIDGGVDYKHEDLAANMYVNEAELNGTPGVDDDGNGYVDDIYGYNFCTDSGVIYPHSHGTHVAGTVAAVNNNGIGVSGVAGGDGTPGTGVRMISCQVFDSRSGVPNQGDFAGALIYAAEKGASIAQCSWGWDTDGYYEQDVIDAVRYFTQMARSESLMGGLCVFATGNSGENARLYPACMPEVLSVAAMTCDYKPAVYSSHGDWVSVIAPGGFMDYDQSQGVLSTLPNNQYGFSEGTSMATPHVAGIAALVLSKHGSATLPSSTLKQQIETSVNDFYAANPSVKGLYGSGNVDAAKALQWGDGSAPSAVTEFTVYPAQNEITLHWTIPASSDNNVNHHIAYYSKEAFTSESDLTGIANQVADTKFLASGDETSMVIEGLEPLTTYYVALQAVDRWGNRSALSEVVETKTNAGPKMTLDKTSLTLTNDGDAAGTATFNVGNTEEGLLKWSVSASTVKSTISTRSLPGLPQQPTVAYNGSLGTERAKAPAKAVQLSEYNAGDYPKTFQYFSNVYAFIGDNDQTVPNALAQHFTVDPAEYPDGFNLTTLRLQGANGKNPLLKIYKGDRMIDESSKLLEFTPDYFAYYYNLTMPEQLYFAPGESFWVVASFPAGDYKYPLGMALTESTTASATNSFMSNDEGKTWMRLSEVLKGSRYEAYADQATWAVCAISYNPDWSQLLVINPDNGEVPQNETTEVQVSTGDSKLCNGTYNLRLNFQTNESGEETHKLPLTLTVKNQAPAFKFNKIVDFGSLLVGQSKTVTVELYNEGYGAFAGGTWSPGLYSNNITSTDPNFKGPDYVANGFQARTATQFDLTFAPVEAGSHSGEIVFTDVKGRTVSITVQGAATEPAKISFDPQAVEVGDLTPGDEPKEATFTIKNEGKYPLQFSFPKFTDEPVEGQAKGGAHKFGYSWTANFSESAGIEYAAPDFIGATDISSQFSDVSVFSNPISLGFDFPYYGENHSEVYITSYGGIAFKTLPADTYWFPPLNETSYGVAETGLISAFGSELKMAPNSKIEYAKKDGKFFVNFSNVMAVVYDQEYIPISFHMSLSPNGDVEIFYDDYDGWYLFGGGKNIFVGVNDFEGADPMTVTSIEMVHDAEEAEDYSSLIYDYFQTGAAVKIIAPSPNIVRSVEPAYGLVSPGKEVEIKTTVSAGDDIYAGPTVTNLVVISNDPLAPITSVAFNANIVGDELQPELKLAAENLDMGDVFRTSDARASLTVKNNGRAAMELTEVSAAEGKVTFATELPATIPAGQSKDVVVIFPTDTEGEVSDVVTVTADCGTATANVRANVIGCPEIALSYDSQMLELEAGSRQEIPLTITNEGNAPLEVAITTGDLLSYTPNAEATKNVKYTYAATCDDSKVKFNWVDIETNGLGTQDNLTYYMSHDFREVELPFAFPFYGKEYNKMYVYNTGFVSFTERNDDKLWPEPPTGLPGETVYTNLIAPYWGLHSMDQTKTAGTYYYVTDDTAVVSFMEYGNSMNIGVCYQLIMHKDGTFKFQYKGNNENSVIFNTFGVAGTSNEDGSEGINLSSRYITFNNAVEFTPVATLELAPEASVIADVVMDASTTMAGEYETAIHVATNVPGNEAIEIPVIVTLTGEAKPRYSDDVTLEHTVMHQSLDFSDDFVMMGAPYAAYFTVSNDGNAPFAIEGVLNEGPSSYDEWYEMDCPLFNVWVEAEELDWMTGEPTGNKQWTQTDWLYSPIIVGSEPVRFAIPMMQNEAWMTPGEYKIPVTLFQVGLPEEQTEKVITVTFNVTEPPVMTLADEEIAVTNVSSTYEGVHSLTVTNDGTYPLTLTAELDLSGNEYDPYSQGEGGGVAPAIAPKMIGEADVLTANGALRTVKPFEYGTDDNYLNLPQEFEYLNGLYYPVAPGSPVIYNYGSDNTYSEFITATAFTAPEEGFNISHIYTAYMPGALKNADIRVQIVKGGDPGGDQILGTGVLNCGEPENPIMSRLEIIALDKPVYVAPGQEFYVKTIFPAGEKGPSVLTKKEESVVSNRYMAYVENYGWYDVGSLFKDNYGSLGYITACLETSEGSAWATLLPESKEAVIEPGESADIKVSINAATAPMNRGNKAMLVLKGNDPMLPFANVPVTLDKNAAPEITGADQIAEINEGSSDVISLTVADMDGDALTLSVVSPAEKVSFISATPLSADGTAEVSEDGRSVNVTGADGANVIMQISADYGDAGSHQYTLATADIDGNTSKVSGYYNVNYTNRPPVALEAEDVTLSVDSSSKPVSMADLFSDPDGEEDEAAMTYAVEVADESVATAFTSGHDVIFFGNKLGKTTATVTATDPKGASAENSFNVEVLDLSGIDGVMADGNAEVWPVPMTDVLNVRFGFTRNDVSVAIYNTAGVKLAEKVTDAHEGEAIALNVSHLDKGAYLLRVEACNDSFAKVVIK